MRREESRRVEKEGEEVVEKMMDEWRGRKSSDEIEEERVGKWKARVRKWFREREY